MFLFKKLLGMIGSGKIVKLGNGSGGALERFLERHSDSSIILRSNARFAGLEYGGKEKSGEYWGAFDSLGDMNGVLAHYWNGNVVTQVPDGEVLRQLVARFRGEATRAVAGVLGPEDQAQVVIQELGLSESQYACNKLEGLFSLELSSLRIPPYNPSATQVINIKDVDRALLKRWMKGFTMEALGAEDNEDLEREVESTLDRMMVHMKHWVLLVDDVPVSLSGWNAYLPTMVQVGPVWTPPEYRNKGFARLVVALTLKNAEKEGVEKAVLIAVDPAAIKAYQNVGFKRIGSYRLALLKKPIQF
eukprot:TRINITY_DN20411_c0_g1_i1.p1 TRINITY_DN20411_c0_g1~~TRINITY_DN20411_c0_g1_i1.p1  ORF type:complete len:303 (+),score=66.83 TRINITY_DN20411_c0_g1_i1:64-972(+)